MINWIRELFAPKVMCREDMCTNGVRKNSKYCKEHFKYHMCEVCENHDDCIFVNSIPVCSECLMMGRFRDYETFKLAKRKFDKSKKEYETTLRKLKAKYS